MTTISGQPVKIFISLNFRWPYHANVMKTFEATSIKTVQIPFIARDLTLKAIPYTD